jgi:hypothetical protein
MADTTYVIGAPDPDDTAEQYKLSPATTHIAGRATTTARGRARLLLVPVLPLLKHLFINNVLEIFPDALALVLNLVQSRSLIIKGVMKTLFKMLQYPVDGFLPVARTLFSRL